MQVAGRLLDHLGGDVDLVLRAGHLGGIDGDLAEVAEPVHAVARQLDAPAVVPGRLELPEFAPHHLVTGAGVAGHVHAAHIDAAARLADQHHLDTPGGAVDLGARLDAREGVAEGAVHLGEAAGRFGDRLGAVRLARFDGHQRLEVVFLAEVLALETDRRHGVGLPFGHVDRDRDVLLVRRDGHLSGVDGELEVAAVQVVSAQCLEIGIELGARIAVRLRVPGEPTTGGQLELPKQRPFGELLVAGDADVADLRDLAFADGEGDVDAVAFHRRDGGDDLGPVQAARQVLALEFLFGAVGQGTVERLAFADAHVLQRFGERVLVELLESDEGHRRDDRPLFDDDDDHVVVDVQSHVLEQAGGEQRTQCGRPLLVAVGIADAEGQRAEDGAGVGPLQAFDADVLQHEGLDRPHRRRVQRRHQGGGKDRGSQRGGSGQGKQRTDRRRG